MSVPRAGAKVLWLAARDFDRGDFDHWKSLVEQAKEAGIVPKDTPLEKVDMIEVEINDWQEGI